MNKKLLLALQKRTKARLNELRTQIEKGEVRAEDLEAMQQEVQECCDQMQEIADALANMSDDDTEDTTSKDEKSEEETEDEEERSNEENNEQRSAITGEQRSAIMTAIGQGLSTRGRQSTQTREREIRSAFANFVVGNISEVEARSLGIEVGNGSVTIPEVIADEIIAYAQIENPLRKYGTRVKTGADVKYPILVKKADANGRKTERGTGEDIPETEIEFDEILLDPSEFDALATVTKKLLKRSGVNVEEIVIEELKKAYVRKEINYMFNGDDVGNENPGALAKKSVAFVPGEVVTVATVNGQDMYDILIDMKNSPPTEVIKKSRWIMNRAALRLVEKMKTADGFPLLRPMTQAEGGIGNMLVGFPAEYTDAADKKGAPDVPVFYFGDFKAFKIQDVIGALEIQKLVEKYAGTNKVGFQIYNLLDGQLVYSPLEPAVYRYEVPLV